MSQIKFRIIEPSDDIKALNILLRDAYRPLAEAGMRYAASHEDIEATKKNIADGECHLAILEEKIIGCVVLRIPGLEEKSGWKASAPALYQKQGVTSFGRFAICPSLQGKGYGSLFLDHLEDRARFLGFEELALDTSEHAVHLIKLYKKRGYRFIEYHQWTITNYRSVVLSKSLYAADALTTIYEELKIEKSFLANNRLPRCEQASLDDLIIVDIDYEGKPFILAKKAAEAWHQMTRKAKSDGISLVPYSGFRSYIYQKHLIKKNLDKGKSLQEILTDTAIPGHSEHHTGCAVDICTKEQFKLSEAFEQTDTFKWLLKNADHFGFTLSYPRNNDKGIIYEPWHWFYRG